VSAFQWRRYPHLALSFELAVRASPPFHRLERLLAGAPVPEATSTDTYELCASLASGTDGEPAETRGDLWSYGSGRQCFKFEARKPTR